MPSFCEMGLLGLHGICSRELRVGAILPPLPSFVPDLWSAEFSDAFSVMDVLRHTLCANSSVENPPRVHYRWDCLRGPPSTFRNYPPLICSQCTVIGVRRRVFGLGVSAVVPFPCPRQQRAGNSTNWRGHSHVIAMLLLWADVLRFLVR